MFRTVAEYIWTFGRVPRQPRIISRSGEHYLKNQLFQFLKTVKDNTMLTLYATSQDVIFGQN